MKQTFRHYYADSTCPYTINGVHLTSLRRARLALVGEVFGIRGNLAKNEIITGLMKKLQALEAPHEISELLEKPKKKKALKKK